MLRYTLKEIYGSSIPPEIQDEELRIAYQVDSALMEEANNVGEKLSQELGLPLETVHICKIALDAAYGHIVSLERRELPRLHILVLAHDTLTKPDFHRRVVAHELSHLFRIVTNQIGASQQEEEYLAKKSENNSLFDFGDKFRERFLASLQSDDL